MRDGDEVKIDAELIFAYQAADESVGIYGGVYLCGIQVGDERVEVEERSVDGKVAYVITDRKLIERLEQGQYELETEVSEP